MALDRRAFLRSLLALPIAATLDVEKLLWIPGQMVVVPRRPLMLDDINAVTLRQFAPGIADTLFKSDPLLAYLKRRRMSVEEWSLRSHLVSIEDNG